MKMTLDELRTLAEQADGCVVLVIPGPPGKCEKIRLCRTHGPRGDILCENSRGGTVARFGKRDLLAWCAKQSEAQAAAEAARKKDSHD